MPGPRATALRRVAPAAAAPWVLWAVLRATGTERGFPLVPAMAFTPHAAVGAVLPLGLALAGRSRRGLALSLTAGTVLGAAARSRARQRQTAPAGAAADRLRLATISLRRGLVPPAAVLDLVLRHDVDVLAVQELTPRALARLRGGGLERLLPHAHVLLAGPGKPAAAAGAIWSRRPITARTAVPGSFEQPTARLSSAAGPLEVTAVHTEPPAISPARVRAWAADLAHLPAPRPEVRRVLAGDFNATPDHAGLRAVIAAGYVDAAAAVGRGREWTWRPLRLRHPRLALDHVLVDPRIRVASVELVAVRGSDHRCVVVDLALPAGD